MNLTVFKIFENDNLAHNVKLTMSDFYYILWSMYANDGVKSGKRIPIYK